ncbi:MAG: hypothetical protein HN348_34200, partial [Proteobacteria bacterium]|nr:hypothetical protein [Pseudomonadota bacterium]
KYTEFNAGDTREAKQVLLADFRYDSGQLLNLGLLYIAEHDDYTVATRKKLTELLEKEEGGPTASSGGCRGSAEETKAFAGPLPPQVHLLDKATKLNRGEVWPILRKMFEQDNGQGAPKKWSIPILSGCSAEESVSGIDTTIRQKLWERYGSDPDVLDNLALEAIAQSTVLLAANIEEMTFEEPVSEIPAKVGVSRTQSFHALSAAHGADDKKLAAIAGGLDPESIYGYLVGLEHVRFSAVARRDWKNDVTLLTDLIGEDKAAQEAARKQSGKNLEIKDIAAKQSLVQAALGAKSWTAKEVAAVLELNPHEARARASIEAADAHMTTTKLLWTKYLPQYKVWIPFAIIGVLATIALGVFGQMAKRWKDMNA